MSASTFVSADGGRVNGRPRGSTGLIGRSQVKLSFRWWSIPERAWREGRTDDVLRSQEALRQVATPREEACKVVTPRTQLSRC